MLDIEVDKLQKLKTDILNLNHFALDVNEQILSGLEKCETCNLQIIKVPSKHDVQEKISAIDTEIVKLLAFFGMEAKDLRLMVAYLKITNEFERIFTRSRSFIRDFPTKIAEVDKDFVLEYVIPLQRSALVALDYDITLQLEDEKPTIEKIIKSVIAEENNNDDLYKRAEQSILKKMDNQVYLTKEYQDILLCLRRVEKIADRALSIAFMLHYAKIGGNMEHFDRINFSS